MKKLFVKSVALGFFFVLGVTAFCSCSKDEAIDESLKSITDKGELVLGLDENFPPMGFRNENGEIVGFDVDVASEVATRMGIKLKFQPIKWEDKETVLNEGRIDCIWSGLSVTAERMKSMCLTEPYMENDMVLIVMKDSKYDLQLDLVGKKVGIQLGSTASDILDASEFKKTVDEIISYHENLSAFLDLELGKLDAVLLDLTVANYVILQQEKDYRVLSDGLKAEEYAVGFRKNDVKLRDEVQKLLKDMKKDGKLAEISTKWFGRDVTTVKT